MSVSLRHRALTRPRLAAKAFAALAAVAMTGLAMTPGAGASGPATVPEALKAASPRLIVDTSISSGCMAGTVQPVAFRSDRISLRWPASSPDPAAEAAVRQGVTHMPPTVRGSWNPAVTTDMRITPPAGESNVAPTVVLSLSPPATEPDQIVALARALRASGVTASPDYGEGFEGGPVGFWPYGFPQPTTVTPPTRAPGTGAAVTVVVYDTGVAPAGQANRPANLVRLDPRDTEVLDRDANGVVDEYYGGHETAIASVIGSIAPAATVVAARVTEADGVATDSSAALRMSTSLRQANQTNAWPQLIVAAFGSPACDGLEPVGLAMVNEAVSAHGRSLIVASAGNVSSTRPFYPAAFDGVVAVGALDATADADGSAWTSPSRADTRATFSNYGPWVDAYAPGVDLQTDHVIGLQFQPGTTINGLALVQGTSFSAPYVAALIAEQLATSGGTDPGQQWTRQLKPSGVPCPLSGGGVALALTSLNATASTPGHGPTSGGC